MIDQFPERFCRNIRTLRSHHNLTIQEMAQILELSDELMRLLESGILTDEMDIRILSNLHCHFGVRPSQIFSKDFQP